MKITEQLASMCKGLLVM